MNLHTGLTISRWILMTSTWLSTLLFGLFILSFYLLAWWQGDMEAWNTHLPGVYQAPGAHNSGMGLHFLFGSLILIFIVSFWVAPLFPVAQALVVFFVALIGLDAFLFACRSIYGSLGLFRCLHRLAAPTGMALAGRLAVVGQPLPCVAGGNESAPFKHEHTNLGGIYV